MKENLKSELKEELQKLKKNHKEIKIPDILNAKVDEEIRQALRKDRKIINILKPTFASLIIACSLLFIIINTSQTAAKTIYEIPFLGDIAKVITFKEYEFKNQGFNVNVSVPKVENIGKETLEVQINKKIEEKIAELTKSLEERSEEAIEGVDPINVDISYEVYIKTKELLSFGINNRETYASSYEYKTFYNYDLIKDKEISLSDIYGEDYSKIIVETIKTQIATRLDENPDFMYTVTEGELDSMEKFDFYINKEKEVVINFGKGVIAPPPMGEQEFVIKMP